MITRINEMIEHYEYMASDITKIDRVMLLNEILSDLEELKKLAGENKEMESIADFVNSQQPMPADFKKVIDDNFWELVEVKKDKIFEGK